MSREADGQGESQAASQGASQGASQAGDPTVDNLVGDLRVLRTRGLVRVRHSELAWLRLIVVRINAMSPDTAADGGTEHRGVETVLQAAVANLGDGDLAAAAAATFGLDRGARDRPARDRRRKAAQVYRVSEERFRKYHEKIVLEQVAEEIMKLGMPLAGPGKAMATRPESGNLIALAGRAAGLELRVSIHIGPVELLRAIDILVVPTNTYIELPQYFKSSISAAVRRMAAVKNTDGHVVGDVVATELAAWISSNARPGLAVAPGTVAVTSSGEMTHQGIRRLYHVAVVTPRPSSNDYEVEPTAIAAGVRNVFSTARSERALFSPELSSIAFPLLGAGRGGLDPAVSFGWIWSALEREVADAGPWQIHFIAPRQELADLMVAKLADSGFNR